MNILCQKTNVILIEIPVFCSVQHCKSLNYWTVCQAEDKLDWYKAQLGRRASKTREKRSWFVCGCQTSYSADRGKNPLKVPRFPKTDSLKDISSFDFINSSRQNYDIYSLHSIVSDSHSHTPIWIINSFVCTPKMYFSHFFSYHLFQ